MTLFYEKSCDLNTLLDFEWFSMAFNGICNLVLRGIGVVFFWHVKL